MNIEIKKKIKLLTDELKKANYEYYQLNKTHLTDQQYDALFRELLTLEKKYPNYKLSYSPTSNINDFLNPKFAKIPHDVPMLSLNNVFTEKELKTFFFNILKKYSHCNFITELKIDGVAVSLKYKKGILTQGITRGNGHIGEIITHNVKTIKNIPLELTQKIDLEVRGEILFNHESFQELNRQQQKQNKKLFANPRNAASGTLRQLNSNITEKRNLFSFIYTLVNPPKYITTQKDALEFLQKLGFNINPHYKIINSFEELLSQIKKYEKLKPKLDYNIDGVVVKINNLNLHSYIGYTSKFPKWAVAYKFNSPQNETIVQDITFQLGRTGSITPVAKLLPVMIGGSLISNANLHNFDYIQKKDIRINDFVLVHKSGSIIPEILKVIKNKRINQLPFTMINHCPFCRFPLTKHHNEINYFCYNKNCDEKKIQKIIHFASREAMDIRILGEQTIRLFFQQKLITKISDLYLLKKFRSQLIKLPGFQTKKINNILEAIEKSKNQTFENILFALGIRHVGSKIAKILTQHFVNIEDLQTATKEKLLKIHEIGYEIVKSIQEYFKDHDNLEEILLLKQHGLKFFTTEHNTLPKNNFFFQKKIVLTGIFKLYSRKKLSAMLEKYGAKITNYVTKKTNYLIYGEHSGSKLTKAQILQIPIINENELYKILKSLIS
ncbi:MAG: NAD-dependent DNA ligase LigA [Vigna little leaf phytoplasma]|nr:NAD-dependent DNA ligase LigA [Vigna little leaf phytoplasma]